MSKKKLFDFCIGNPPYNTDFNDSGENKNFAAPVYNIFMEGAYSVARKVELIHPARFLFRAGSTPKEFDDKMLSDTHFKVLQYEQDASKVFPNTDIKGGIVISYRDENQNFGEIGIFTPSSELRSINSKTSKGDFTSIADIVYTQSKFNCNYSVVPAIG